VFRHRPFGQSRHQFLPVEVIRELDDLLCRHVLDRDSVAIRRRLNRFPLGSWVGRPDRNCFERKQRRFNRRGGLGEHKLCAKGQYGDSAHGDRDSVHGFLSWITL
jgi:hypothetical protein